MNVWFDSEMGYMDWFRLDFEKYYIIYQDEYLVKGSLDPDHLFTAYEVKIHTGGVEFLYLITMSFNYILGSTTVSTE
jgi:hypothetical protein